MDTIAIERLTPAASTILPRFRPQSATPQSGMDHDIAEVAIGFGQRFGHRTHSADFGTTTHAAVTFRKVDPLREPLEVADRRLQARLETLCETLRAKY